MYPNKAGLGLKNLIYKVLGVMTPVFMLLIFQVNAKAEDFIPPIADYSYSGTDLYITFKDLSSDPDTKIVEWYWDLGDGTFQKMAQTFTHNYAYKGKYQVKLEVVDATGLRNSITKEITVSGPNLISPNAAFSYAFFNKTITYTDGSLDQDGKVVEWYWDLGDGTHKSGERVFNYTYLEGGLYKVTLEVVDNTGLKAKVTKDVLVVGTTPIVPVAAFSYTASNNTISFKDGSYDPDKTITEWYWDLGDGTHLSKIQNFSHTYKFGGSYKVELEVVDSTNLRNSVEKTIAVTGPQKQAPIANFYYSSGDQITFGFGDNSTTENGKITQWYWDFGDGTHTSMQKEVVHKYVKNGSYKVKLEVVDEAGMRATKEQTIEAKGAPIYNPYVAFTKDMQTGSLTVVYHADAVSFNGQITEYYWDFGDGTFAKNQKDITHIYNTSGVYTVKLEVVDNFGARSSFQEQITMLGPVLGKPKVSFTYYNDQKTPKFTFYDSSTSPNGIIVERYWDFGDGTFASNKTIIDHTYTSAGIYTVRLEVVDILGERNSYSIKLTLMPNLFQ